jgi:hypothetical protein
MNNLRQKIDLCCFARKQCRFQTRHSRLTMWDRKTNILEIAEASWRVHLESL